MENKKEVIQIISNLILNYIAPAAKRLNINTKNFIRPETLSIMAEQILIGKYTMQKFKDLIKEKERTYSEDMKTFGNPFVLDSFELITFLSKDKLNTMSKALLSMEK